MFWAIALVLNGQD